MSQPNIPKIKIDPSRPPLQRERGELSQLQWSSVKVGHMTIT